MSSMASVVMTLSLLGASPDWTAAFPPAAIGSHAGEGTTAVLVAAAGEPSADRDAAAPAPVAAPAPAPSPSPGMDEWTARRLYNERAIRMESMTATNAQGYVVATESLGRQGKQVLSTEDLLIRVGRRDLARDLAERTNLKGTLMVTGILGAMAGVAMAPFAGLASCTAKSATTLQCVRRDYTWLTVSGVVAGGGIALWVAGYLIPTTLSPATVRQLADDHNDKLMRDLGLRSDAGGGTGAGADTGSVQIALSPAGLTLSGTF